MDNSHISTEYSSQFSSHLLHVLKDVCSSIVGSAACVYSGQPFDTVKVRMQVNSGQYSSAIQCFKTTFAKEGITAFWRGSAPAFTGALLENAAAFGTNGVLKRIIVQRNMDTNSYYMPFLTGGFTGFCSSFVLCPCDVVKCRAQVLNMSSSGLSGQHTIQKVVGDLLRTKGPRGLYTGMSAQLLRDVPFYASFFGSYEVLCRLLRKASQGQWSDPAIYLLAGGVAGQIGWLCSIVPDSIKSRIQTRDEGFGIAKTAQEIYRKRGLRGFFVGLEVAIVRAFPANAALFVGYELTKELFEATLLGAK